MASIYQFSEIDIFAFILIFIRMSAFVVSWPVFGVRSVPNQVKVLFALITSMVLFPLVDKVGVTPSVDNFAFIMIIAKEILVGISLGFLARSFFFVVSVAGELTSVSMGLSSSQLFNPALGTQSSSVEQFQGILATLFFLALNGHHIFLNGIVMSFDLVSLAALGVQLTGMSEIAEVLKFVTVIGLKLAAPVVISILFLNLCMAVIGRAVPQINVLVTSLPINIMAGFVVMILALPVMIWQFEGILNDTALLVFKFIKSY